VAAGTSSPRGASTLAAVAKHRRGSTGPPSKLDRALAELDGLLGLDTVKTKIAELAYFTSVDAERASHRLQSTEVTRHMVMLGNPGTGKTTVARLLGEIYCGYGLLERSKVYEVDARVDLVGEYEGHTAPKVEKTFKKALGGVLFIDEAYRLVDDNPNLGLGKEAVSTLVPLLENHRHDILVIVAGYPEPMRKLLRSNPGLKGRFGPTIRFPDYSDEELREILQRMCATKDYDLTGGALARSAIVIPRARELLGDTFDNARCVRRLFETAVSRHHARVGRLKRILKRKANLAELREILEEDIPNADELVPDAE
jgi:SpoVK/Ycf46/Vps4 family AAA+-type ATPase